MQPTKRPTLIDALEAIQEDKGWSDQEMANELGISDSLWNLVRRGQRQPGNKMLGGVETHFPELRPLVSLFLRRQVTGVTRAAQPVKRRRKSTTPAAAQATPVPA